jgi:hypothetical protein
LGLVLLMVLMVVSLIGLTSCGGAGGTAKPVIRSILGFDEVAAVQSNHGVQGGFPTPQAAMCGDTNSTFLAELQSRSPDQAKVPFEWAPVVPNTSQPWPTVDERPFLVSGQIAEQDYSDHDILFAHPFGKDLDIGIKVDDAFNELKRDPNSATLGWEIERGLLPHDNAGDFSFGPLQGPQVGDRIATAGDWIVDCGHDDYHTEIHPPAFLALARAEQVQQQSETVSFAFANPYRVTQLYNPNDALANAFATPAQDLQRFKDGETKPFPAHMYDEIKKIVLLQSTVLEAHVLVEPTTLGVLSWYVCAPGPRGGAGNLGYAYHYTMRTGVAIQAVPHDDIGCVQFIAAVNANYQPMSLTRHVVTWPWSQINTEAQLMANNPNLDILQKIEDGAADPGVNHFFANDPKIDTYDPLNTLLNYHLDQQPGLLTSDAQPFPFYGWAIVSWRPPQMLCCVTPPPLPTAEPTATSTPTPTPGPLPQLSVSPAGTTNVTCGSLPLTYPAVTVKNSGSGTLTWQVMATNAHVMVSPASGSLSAGQSQTLSVSQTSGGAGTDLKFSSNGGSVTISFACIPG